MSALTRKDRKRYKSLIGVNRAKIFDLEGIVNHNKAKSYLLRAKTSENAALISKNYNSAFMGNRQLANENTDAIFRNKIALMQSLPSNNQAEINYREAKINEAKLQFLDHRSALNAQVVAITKDLAILNEHAIAINRRIMETNEAIKDMNAALNAEISATIELIPAAPSPEAYVAIVASNAAKIEEIMSRVALTTASMEALDHTTETNRAFSMGDTQLINIRLAAIKANYDAISADRLRIAELLAEC